MGNNWVKIILHHRWNLAAARAKRGNAFKALMWFPDFGTLHLWKNFRTNAPIPTVLGDVLFYYTWSLIRWQGIWSFHHRLLESLIHVAFLPWRDGASYSQATTTTPLSLSFLLFPPGSRIVALLMLIWSFHLASDRSKRWHRVARYRHLVLMVKVERRNLLTIHIPHSRATDRTRLKNKALSPSARIAAADLAARSRPSPIQR